MLNSFRATVFLLLVGPVSVHAVRAAEAIFVGAGDIAKCGKWLDSAEATASLLDEILSEDPAVTGGGEGVPTVVYTLGDNAYKKGTAKEFRECYGPTWGRHKDHTRPTVGNHEYKTSGASPYFDYFGEAAGERGKGYYSYKLGDWHMVALNSVCKEVGGCGKNSPQYRWLVGDLDANPARCTLAYFHHPIFSSGKHGSRKAMRPILETLYAHGVDVVLAGHDHNYERFAPQDANGVYDPDRGVRQFVVGTGGREHRRIGRPQPNSEVRDSTSFGVLKLTLHPDHYGWEFIPVEGATFRDSGSGRCH